MKFQHTATRRWLGRKAIRKTQTQPFQHTATRRWLGRHAHRRHPKDGFNTQPPEGGWRRVRSSRAETGCFNTQPPEGGWIPQREKFIPVIMFQHTATRRWLEVEADIAWMRRMFQHTATRRWLVRAPKTKKMTDTVSTHSHPKVAGYPASLSL